MYFTFTIILGLYLVRCFFGLRFRISVQSYHNNFLYIRVLQPQIFPMILNLFRVRFEAYI